MMPGADVQAAASELIAISPARGSLDLRTSRDYLPVVQMGPGNVLTNLLIAGPACAGCRLNYAIDSAGRVSQVVRQRSAKPPPRVRIPHSPPFFSQYKTWPGWAGRIDSDRDFDAPPPTPRGEAPDRAPSPRARAGRRPTSP